MRAGLRISFARIQAAIQARQSNALLIVAQAGALDKEESGWTFSHEVVAFETKMHGLLYLKGDADWAVGGRSNPPRLLA
jgi:hypothetical protein